ncbi:Uncharacterized protein GBIM_16901 [Gryllus bimaculatus]|nr:Uncharacterized protein GBIM_16901 [Gryllus bimaculatus]
MLAEINKPRNPDSRSFFECEKVPRHMISNADLIKSIYPNAAPPLLWALLSRLVWLKRAEPAFTLRFSARRSPPSPLRFAHSPIPFEHGSGGGAGRGATDKGMIHSSRSFVTARAHNKIGNWLVEEDPHLLKTRHREQYLNEITGVNYTTRTRDEAFHKSLSGPSAGRISAGRRRQIDRTQLSGPPIASSCRLRTVPVPGASSTTVPTASAVAASGTGFGNRGEDRSELSLLYLVTLRSKCSATELEGIFLCTSGLRALGRQRPWRRIRAPRPALCGAVCLKRVLGAVADVPKFGELINNVTAPVGREATLACVVEDLLTYKRGVTGETVVKKPFKNLIFMLERGVTGETVVKKPFKNLIFMLRTRCASGRVSRAPLKTRAMELQSGAGSALAAQSRPMAAALIKTEKCAKSLRPPLRLQPVTSC